MEIAGSRAVPWARRWSDRRSNGEDPTGRQRMRSTPVLNDREAPQFQGAAGPSVGFARRAGAFVLHEYLEMLPPTIFFFVGFNLIVLTTHLILADYSVALAASCSSPARRLSSANRCWSPTRWRCCGVTIA